MSLKAQINALATKVESMTAQAGAATIGVGAVTAVNSATLAGGITGGDPSAGVKAAK